MVGPSTNPPPAGTVDNNQPQINQPSTNQQELTNSPATVHQQPANRSKTYNRPRSTDQHLQPTIPPITHSQQPAHWPKSDNRPTTASTHRPANQLLTIISLLISLRLITVPVLHFLTSNRPLKRPLFISSPLTGLRLINLDLIPAPHLYRILTLIPIMTAVQELTTGHYEDSERSDPKQDTSVNEPDQSSTEEQNYRETMCGVRSYMGWTHIPDMDTHTSSAEDNPFATRKQQTVGKVSVTLPTYDWLCR